MRTRQDHTIRMEERQIETDTGIGEERLAGTNFGLPEQHLLRCGGQVQPLQSTLFPCPNASD